MQTFSIRSAFIFMLLATAATGQEQQAESFGEVIDVRVLNLEVSVTDKDGYQIEGLTADDFRLLVDGNEVPIEYFSEIRHGSALPTALPTAEGIDPVAATATVPSVTPGKRVGTSFLLFVDNYFGHSRDRSIVLENIIETVPRLNPEDRMAIVSFDGRRLDMISTWESSHREIVRNLRKALGAKAGGLQRRAELNFYELQLRNLNSGMIEESQINATVEYVRTLSRQVDTVVKAATASMRAMASPPGRKLFLLTSGGWPSDPTEFVAGLDSQIRNRTLRYSPRPAFDDLTSTANKLGYTIYPIDMAGRQSRLSVDASNATMVGDNFVQQVPTTDGDGPPGPGGGTPPPTPEEVYDTTMDAIQAGFEATAGREQLLEAPLIAMANETGGKAMINSFRSSALPRTIEDTASYYWLGYTPSWERDDAAHKVEIEVLRKGAKARTRKSFRDLSRQSEVSMLVESNLLFDTELHGHSLEAEFGEAKTKRGKVFLPVTLKIPMDRVLMLPVAGGFEANLELRVAVIDEKGARSDIPIIPIKLAGPTAPPAGSHALYDTTLTIRKGQQQLALVVYDVSGETMLSSSHDFDPASL